MNYLPMVRCSLKQNNEIENKKQTNQNKQSQAQRKKDVFLGNQTAIKANPKIKKTKGERLKKEAKAIPPIKAKSAFSIQTFLLLLLQTKIRQYEKNKQPYQINPKKKLELKNQISKKQKPTLTLLSKKTLKAPTALILLPGKRTR